MEEFTFLSIKTKKEIYKFSIITLIAVITWIIQLSIFSRLIYSNTTPSLIYLVCILLGLRYGITIGTFFGIVSSFFIASCLYDQIYYLSFPIIGLISGLLKKYSFADEFLFFILLIVLLIFPLEALNGFQFGYKNSIDISSKIIGFGSYGIILNILAAPFVYLIFNQITKRIHIK